MNDVDRVLNEMFEHLVATGRINRDGSDRPSTLQGSTPEPPARQPVASSPDTLRRLRSQGAVTGE